MAAMLYTIHAEDKPGTLGVVAGALEDAGINIDAFSAGPGGLRIITAEDADTSSCLKKAGMSYDATEVIEIELENKPGALARVAQALGAGNVNIQVSFGAARGQEGGSIFIAVDDVDSAWEALEGVES